MASPRYSIVVPVYNEEEVLPEFYAQLNAVLGRLDGAAEIVFVDDGSRDRSTDVLKALHARDGRVRIVSLSRNFGHQAAVTAGFAHTRGQAVAILDADLQDPPELPPRFFETLAQGYDVVYGIRTERKEGGLKRLAYFAFYRMLKRLAEIDVPMDSGDFCVMSRRVVANLNALAECDPFVRGLRAWLGFRQIGIPYERDARYAGAPKYTLRKLVVLALDGLLSFSTAPLWAIVGIGLVISSLSLVGMVVVLYRFVFTPYVPGYTSLAMLVLFVGGIQLLTLGVIGEYVGRIAKQVKARPLFVVDELIGFDED